MFSIPRHSIGFQIAEFTSIRLLEGPEMSIKPCTTLNSATFLPHPNPKASPCLHSCLEIIDQTYNARPDLRDNVLPNLDVEWFTVGRSSIQEGRRVLGYATVSLTEVIESGPLHGAILQPKGRTDSSN